MGTKTRSLATGVLVLTSLCGVGVIPASPATAESTVASPAVAARVAANSAVGSAHDTSLHVRAAERRSQGSDEPSTDLDSPDRIREDTRRILESDEYSYEKSLIERFLEWLGDRLGNRQPAEATGHAPVMGGLLGTIIVWLVLIAVAVGVALIVVRYVRRRTPRERKKSQADPVTVVEHVRSVDEWMSEAERLESEGEWKLAIRARYRQLVRELTDRGQLPDVAGSTTLELREALVRSTPSATQSFDQASLLFELPWYGAAETGPDENQMIKRLSVEVLAAEPVGLKAVSR